jgi:hypothetical protein
MFRSSSFSILALFFFFFLLLPLAFVAFFFFFSDRDHLVLVARVPEFNQTFFPFFLRVSFHYFHGVVVVITLPRSCRVTLLLLLPALALTHTAFT